MDKQQVALITGASQGLGFEVAKILSKRKVKLILTGRDSNKLQKCLAGLDNNAQHELLIADLTKYDSLADMLATLDAKKLFPDIVIHCLGGKVDGDKQPLETEVLEASIRLNLGVAVKINQHFLPKMQINQNGCIVHVSSDASLTGDAAPGYVAAKSAINAYVRSTARYYAKNQILICAVLPGVFEHENSAWTLKKISDPLYYEKKQSLMPLERFLYCTEIAEVIGDIAYKKNMVYSGSLIDLSSS